MLGLFDGKGKRKSFRPPLVSCNGRDGIPAATLSPRAGLTGTVFDNFDRYSVPLPELCR